MAESIYIISGLGADERVFKHLNYGAYQPIYIQWISPHKDDTMESYARRLLPQIKSPNPVLMGLSLGGMLAVEIAGMIPTQKVIVLASAKNLGEIPFYLRWLGKTGLHKWMPVRMMKQPKRFHNWLFGAKTPATKQLLELIVSETEPAFLKWALNAILHWKSKNTAAKVFHIHGSKDHVLPLRYVKCDAVIEGGGHLMTLENANEVNVVLRKCLT